MLHRRLLAATLTFALAAPTLAHADGPTPQATQQARSHYKQGKAYQEAGAYDKAIAEYLEADRLAPRPEMFFNIAQCHRLAGHKQAAVDYYRRFVSALPSADGADEARMYIAQLEKQLDAIRGYRRIWRSRQDLQLPFGIEIEDEFLRQSLIPLDEDFMVMHVDFLKIISELGYFTGSVTILGRPQSSHFQQQKSRLRVPEESGAIDAMEQSLQQDRLVLRPPLQVEGNILEDGDLIGLQLRTIIIHRQDVS